eukprot:718667_1
MIYLFRLAMVLFSIGQLERSQIRIFCYIKTWSADEFNLVTIISWHYEEDRGWDSFNDKIHLTLAQAKEDMDNALAMAFEAAEQCHIPLVLDATYQYVPQVRTNFITE